MRFENIPEAEHAAICAAVARRDTGYLVYIHDRYIVTDYRYCCGEAGRQGEVYDMFVYAIDQKLIR